MRKAHDEHSGTVSSPKAMLTIDSLVISRSAAAAFFVATAIVLVLVPLVRAAAQRLGAIDRPGGRKIHLRPVPRMGGLAVVAAVVASSALAPLAFGETSEIFFSPVPWAAMAIILLSLAALGARDDISPVSANTKLALELVAGTALLAIFPVKSIDFGLFVVPETWAIASGAVVVLWVATVTNAYNMIDGMDGLASGIGAIAAAAMGFAALIWEPSPAVVILMGLAGALVGFLIFNSRPASIFLGDAGSIPIGFLLSALGVVAFTRGTSWYAVPAVIAVAVPLLDLGVAVTRRLLESLELVRHDEVRERFQWMLNNRPRLFAADGRHIHHRLLTLGVSQRGAVLSLYCIGFAFALLTMANGWLRYAAPIAFLGLVGVLTFFSSRWLYEELRVLRRGFLLPIFETRFARSRVVHILFDLTGLALAVSGAYWLVSLDRSESVVGGTAFLTRAAVAAVIGAAVFWASGLYAISFRRAGQWVLIRAALTVALATLIASSADLVLFGSGVSWAAWILAGYLGFTFTILPRFAYRLFDAIHQRSRDHGCRVAVLGAGRGGAVALRELLENPRAQMRPVAFIDDDPALWRRVVEGYPIHPGGARLGASLAELSVDRLLIASSKLSGERRSEVRRICANIGVSVSFVRVAVEEDTVESRSAELDTFARASPAVPPG